MNILVALTSAVTKTIILKNRGCSSVLQFVVISEGEKKKWDFQKNVEKTSVIFIKIHLNKYDFENVSWFSLVLKETFSDFENTMHSNFSTEWYLRQNLISWMLVNYNNSFYLLLFFFYPFNYSHFQYSVNNRSSKIQRKTIKCYNCFMHRVTH